MEQEMTFQQILDKKMATFKTQKPPITESTPSVFQYIPGFPFMEKVFFSSKDPLFPYENQITSSIDHNNPEPQEPTAQKDKPAPLGFYELLIQELKNSPTKHYYQLNSLQRSAFKRLNDYLEIDLIKYGISSEAVKRIYRRLAKELHPDLNSEIHPFEFQNMHQDIQTLSDVFA